MISQRIGRLPIRIIGLGMRWVASPMRTPRPAAEDDDLHAVTAPLWHRSPGAKTDARGSGHTSSAPHSDRVRKLLADLRREVPGQDQDQVRTCLGDHPASGSGIWVPGVYFPCL